MERKGLSAAITIIIAIIVMIIIGIAIVSLSSKYTNVINEQGKAVEKTDFKTLACSTLLSEKACSANELCQWKNNKCQKKPG